MPFFLSPDQEDQLFSSLSSYVAKRDTYSAAATPLHAAAISDLYKAAPTAAPGVIAAAAKQVAASPDPQAAATQARAAVQAAAQAQHFSLTVPVKNVSNTPQLGLNPIRDLTEIAKPVVRSGLAAAQAGLEYTTNRGAQSFHRLEDVGSALKQGDLGGAVSATGQYLRGVVADTAGPGASGLDAQKTQAAAGATTIAKAVGNVAQGYGPGLGQGWLPEGFSTHEQAAAARDVRGTINGHAWTLGRQLASYVVEPGTRPYQLLSGLVDAGVAIKGDPAAIAGGEVAQAREAAAVFKPVTEAQLADEATKASAGLLDAERYTIDKMRADQWMNSPVGRKVNQSIADDSSFLSIFNKLGRKADPRVVAQLAEESDPAKTAELIRGQLGLNIRSARDVSAASSLYEVQRSVRRFLPWADDLNASGAFAMSPKKYLTLASDATDPERLSTIENSDNFLRMLGADADVRSKAIGQMAAAMSGTPFEKFDAATNYMKTLRQALIDSGMDEERAKAFTKLTDHDGVVAYGQRQLYTGSDVGHLARITGDPETYAVGPGLLSEGFNGRFTLPDPRQMNRLTSWWGRIVATGVSDRANLRLPFAAAESFQNIWKQMTVLRVATAVRILGEEQVRVAANDMPSLFNHPLNYLMAVLGDRQKLTAEGLDFNFEAGLGGKEGVAFNKAMRDNIYRSAQDEADGASHLYRTGQWDWVDRATKPVEYDRGNVHTWGQLSADPFANAMARGATSDDMMRAAGFEGGVWDASKVDPAFQAATKDVIQRGAAGEAAANSRGTFSVVTDYTNPENFRAYLENNIARRLQIASGGDQRILDVIGHNVVGVPKEMDSADLTFLKAGPKDPVTGKTLVGSTVKDADGNIGKVTVYMGDGKSQVVFGRPALDEGALYRDHEGTPLGDLLKEYRETGNGPQSVKYPRLAYDKDVQKSTSKLLDQALRPFFGALMDKPSRLLSRSPVFRAAYYDRMAELAEHLTPEDANQLLKNIGADAAHHGFLNKVSDFLGGDRQMQRVVDAAGRANGELKLADLDMYAKGHALDTVQNLLYDASRKRSFEDGLRIISPFEQAFKEILTSWGRLLARNPVGIARRADQIVSGARGAGFFYTDPTTGQEMFGYHGSNILTRALTGSNPVTDTLAKVPGLGGLFAGGPPVDASFGAPVQGLNIAGTFLPTAGPAVQMPLSAIIPAKPGWEEVRALLLPYGESPSLQSTLIPDWMEKIIGAIRDKPESNGMYGKMYVDALSALSASGHYNRNDPTSMDQMKSDAAAKARTLLILRGLGQFTLPAAPQPDEKIHTQAGDIMASELAKEYAKMERDDYQNAVGNFIDTFGEGPFLYAIGKTKAVNGGLSPSKAFGDWEANHGGFMSSYSKVAGFFGPVGDDFSMDVYQRQLDQGERTRLTDQQMIDASQATIARWKYNQLRDAAGPNPSAKQRDLLAQAKQVLQQQYPAYATYSSYNPTELPAAINQLKQAAADPRVKDSPVAEAVNKYMELRDAALQAARQRTGSASTGLGGAKMADLRNLLDDAALEISRQHPEFQRVWDYLLSREVDTQNAA